MGCFIWQEVILAQGVIAIYDKRDGAVGKLLPVVKGSLTNDDLPLFGFVNNGRESFRVDRIYGINLMDVMDSYGEHDRIVIPDNKDLLEAMLEVLLPLANIITLTREPSF